jgi:hypothetical protein
VFNRYSSHSKALQVMTIHGESEENEKRGRFFNVLYALKNSDSVQLKVYTFPSACDKHFVNFVVYSERRVSGLVKIYCLVILQLYRLNVTLHV